MKISCTAPSIYILRAINDVNTEQVYYIACIWFLINEKHNGLFCFNTWIFSCWRYIQNMSVHGCWLMFIIIVWFFKHTMVFMATTVMECFCTWLFIDVEHICALLYVVNDTILQKILFDSTHNQGTSMRKIIKGNWQVWYPFLIKMHLWEVTNL